MNTTDKRNKISEVTEDIARSLGAELIECKLILLGSRHVVRCLVDYACGGITIDTCSKINKKIISYIEDEGLFSSGFTVEVNSPGLDRPLRSANDFLRAKGKVISLWLNREAEGKTSIEVKVIGVDGNDLITEYEEGELKINLDDIKIGKEKIVFNK
jgi:ribosome maturation factor RimP